MKDRVPANPGRVLITPETGAAAFYATMTRADNPTQVGDPINKDTLLKDSTAALFGFDASALPDNVLQMLAPNSLVNMHVWGKYSTASEYYLIQRYNISNRQYFNASSHDYTKYYTEASIVDGQIVLSGSQPEDYTEMVGCYYLYTSGDTSEYRKVKGVSIGDSGTSSDLFTYYVVTVGERQAGELVEYVASVDQNAYPPAESDGYTYTALGQLGNKVQIATVSYTGTGIKGDKEIIFPVVPKIVFVSRNDGSYMYFPYVWGEAFLLGINASSASFSKSKSNITVSGATLTVEGGSTLVNSLDAEGVTYTLLYIV